MFNILLGIQLLAVMGSFAGFVVLLRTRPSRVQVLMLATNVCVYLQCLGYLLEMTSTSFDGAKISIFMQYSGGVFLNLFYALFMFEYCKISVPVWLRNTLFGYSAFVYLNILTAPQNTFYYSSMEFVESGLFPHMELGHGPLYLINIAIIMITTLAGFLVTIYSYFRKGQEHNRKRLWVLIIASFVPILGYIVGIAKDSYGYYDPVPASAAFACIIITIAVLRGGLFDVVGSAHEYILGALEDAFVVLDENYNLLEANESAKKLFPELNNAQISVRAPKRIRECFKLESGEEMNLDGKYYNMHVQEVYNKEVLIGYAAIWFDITESKLHFEEMKELKIQADNANREKSNFLARMSHEIRTPMNAIIGYSELILQERIDNKVENFAMDIKSASNNLLSIINSILDISKIESGKLEIVEGEYFTQSLLYDIMSVILIPIRKKGLKFINDIDGNVPVELYGDSLRIRQVMINLLNNAVKFTEEGSITLSLKCINHSEDEVYLEWRISDTGKGIKKEDIQKIFGQFEQVDKQSNYAVEGTGLGLSISKSLIEAMDGTIEVRSEYGEGTTFIVRLKQKVVNAKPIEQISIDSLMKDNKQKEKISFIAPMARVLIVDDNPVNLDVLRGYLRHYKIVPDLAGGGKEAIDKIQRKKYDIVFMDQMMPDMDGVETTELVRKIGFTEGKLTIIALTANAISGTKEYLMSKGFNDYASKPISIKQLEELLLKHLPPAYIEYQSISTDRNAVEDFEEGEEELLKDKPSVVNNTDAGNGAVLGFSMEGIDMKEGLALCGGNMKTYIAVLKAVCQYGDEKIQLMGQCIRDKDYNRYTIEAHALKSNAASIGAKQVSLFAKEQEMAGKEGRFEEIDEKGNELLAEYRKMLEIIENFLKQRESKKKEQDLEQIILDDRR